DGGGGGRRHAGVRGVQRERAQKLRIVTPIRDTEVREGSEIVFNCEMNMEGPDPRVKWTKADLVLRADDRVAIDTQPGHSKLSVARTTRGDSATYIIEAVNTCGRATATAAETKVDVMGQCHSFDGKCR
uniref:Ig-like domain-containing protein n=1 Tax=Hippocampus comes TaxID=109280 RepID=A0A3Q2Z1V9_HIPCM